ncbi:class I SAM-dependent methyltransferase [Sphingoaurantiacus capsulatus]|uniref:Class I SAM-dependent methyltransferase n=1 Tax=Sphingoaurantiacus capsulatus TaxID=1771310 RepID=A0ABV7XBM2_9SPHN
MTIALLLASCDARSAGEEAGHVMHESAPASAFPKPHRAVADIVSDQFSNEDDRDSAGEAEKVMALLGVKPGMTVADIGAGNGYYTVRLSKQVGENGRVFAEDIMPAYVDRLRGRVEAEGLPNVTVTLGEPHDPKLPTGEADLALLMHMYHEVEQPFGLLWHLHAALKPGGRVAVADMDRPTNRHGTPPALLRCELAALGYRQIGFHQLAAGSGYLAVFETAEPRPSPKAVQPCKG